MEGIHYDKGKCALMQSTVVLEGMDRVLTSLQVLNKSTDRFLLDLTLELAERERDVFMAASHVVTDQMRTGFTAESTDYGAIMFDAVPWTVYQVTGTQPHEIPNSFGWGITLMHPGIQHPHLADTWDTASERIQAGAAEKFGALIRAIFGI